MDEPDTAAPAAAGDSGSRYEVHVGFACCYRCVFCPSAAPGSHRRRARIEEVTTEIDRAARRGATSLNFSGGEPSIHPAIEEMVRHARDRGFGHIGMITNGRGLSDPNRLSSLCDAGLSQVSLSFHSHEARLEDRITGTEGSFEHKARALDNLVAARRAGALADGFSVKTVLHRRILDRLEDLVDFFVQRGVHRIGFNFIRPDHRARDKTWVPRLADTMPRLRDLVARNESEWNIELGFLDIPWCKLPWEVLSIPHLRRRYVGRNDERGISIFLGEQEPAPKRIEWKDERADVMKTHPAACGKCPLRNHCEGVWRAYLDVHGQDEFAAGPGVVKACLGGNASLQRASGNQPGQTR